METVSSKMNHGSFDIPEVCDKTAVNACDESVTACVDINNKNVSCDNDKFVIGCDKTSTKTCDPSVINTSDKSDDKNVSCDMTQDAGISAIDYNVKKSFDEASFKNSHVSFDNMDEQENTSAETCDTSINIINSKNKPRDNDIIDSGCDVTRDNERYRNSNNDEQASQNESSSD